MFMQYVGVTNYVVLTNMFLQCGIYIVKTYLSSLFDIILFVNITKTIFKFV